MCKIRTDVASISVDEVARMLEGIGAFGETEDTEGGWWRSSDIRRVVEAAAERVNSVDQECHIAE